jgi:hypothetical protein
MKGSNRPAVAFFSRIWVDIWILLENATERLWMHRLEEGPKEAHEDILLKNMGRYMDSPGECNRRTLDAPGWICHAEGLKQARCRILLDSVSGTMDSWKKCPHGPILGLRLDVQEKGSNEPAVAFFWTARVELWIPGENVPTGFF